MSHYFDKLWGKRKEPRPQPRPSRPTPVQPREPAHVAPHKQAVIDAEERRRRQWKRYLEARRSRLVQVAKDHPNVGRYRATLKAILKDPEAKWTGARDCNVGLAELCEELALREVRREYDRFLLLEVTNSFITALGKRDGIDAQRLVDDQDPLPLSSLPPPTEMDRVKAALNLR